MARTHRSRWNVRHGFPPEASHSIGHVAKYAGLPIATLRKVYNRGIGAYTTNPTSVRLRGSYAKNATAPLSARLGPQQWAMARVYAFVNKLETGRLNHDADLVPRFEITPSKRKNKKYVATFADGRPSVHFGHTDYQHYRDVIGHHAHLDHGDKKRRANYYARHGRHPKAFTAKWFAHHILWPIT